MRFMFNVAAIIISFVIFSCNPAFSYKVDKNDMMTFLRSKGHKVSVDKQGDITVKIRTDAANFKLYIFLKKSKGKTWGIKTRHEVPLKIRADKAELMMRLANVYNRRKGVFRTAYIRKKRNKFKLIVKSWFPCEYVSDSTRDAMFMEYYENSFKMMTRKLKTIYSAAKCVLDNSNQDKIENCLEKFGLSKGF